jgi:hypothetical protein
MRMFVTMENGENGEKKLVKALNLARKLGHKVLIKTYDEGIAREEGTPDYHEFDYENILVDDKLVLWQMPVFEGNGCNDVVIEVNENAHRWEYNVWYSDIDENRVYADEIDNYLNEYSDRADTSSAYEQLAKDMLECAKNIEFDDPKGTGYFTLCSYTLNKGTDDEVTLNVMVDLCKYRDSLDGHEYFGLYNVGEIDGGDDITEHDWEYTKDCSLNSLILALQNISDGLSFEELKKAYEGSVKV